MSNTNKIRVYYFSFLLIVITNSLSVGVLLRCSGSHMMAFHFPLILLTFGSFHRKIRSSFFTFVIRALYAIGQMYECVKNPIIDFVASFFNSYLLCPDKELAAMIANDTTKNETTSMIKLNCDGMLITNEIDKWAKMVKFYDNKVENMGPHIGNIAFHETDSSMLIEKPFPNSNQKAKLSKKAKKVHDDYSNMEDQCNYGMDILLTPSMDLTPSSENISIDQKLEPALRHLKEMVEFIEPMEIRKQDDVLGRSGYILNVDIKTRNSADPEYFNDHFSFKEFPLRFLESGCCSFNGNRD